MTTGVLTSKYNFGINKVRARTSCYRGGKIDPIPRMRQNSKNTLFDKGVFDVYITHKIRYPHETATERSARIYRWLPVVLYSVQTSEKCKPHFPLSSFPLSSPPFYFFLPLISSKKNLSYHTKNLPRFRRTPSVYICLKLVLVDWC